MIASIVHQALEVIYIEDRREKPKPHSPQEPKPQPLNRPEHQRVVTVAE